MKRILITLSIASTLFIAVAAFADKTMPTFKTGESVYVCGCGDSCACKTMSRKEGKCSCNTPLVKGTVSKVEGDKAVVKVNDKDRNFTTKATYACACGNSCGCGTTSQKPGKCGCGSDMKKTN